MSAGNTTAVAGLVKLSAVILGIASIMSLVSGDHGHWLPVIAGLGVGWVSVASINGK